MNVTKTIASLAGGSVAMLTLAGMAQAYTVSSGATTTFSSTPTSVASYKAATVISPSASEIATPSTGSMGHYNTEAFGNPTNAAGAPQWVTVSAISGIPQSVTNGGTFYFISPEFNSASPVINPFSISGMSLSDNVLQDIYLVSNVGGTADILATDVVPSSAEGSPDGVTSYSTPFSFSGISGGVTPDYLVFQVLNQTQAAPTATSNPVAIDYSFTVTSAVPEPGAVAPFALGGLGLLGLALRARRNRVAA